MDLLESMGAVTVRKTIERWFKKLESELRKSILFDPGKENSVYMPRGYIELAEKLKKAVYFCHPHSLWEKGRYENTNYLIRDMLYPADDFRKLTRWDVSRIAGLLNGRPRKTLDWKTLKEVFLNLRQELPSAYINSLIFPVCHIPTKIRTVLKAGKLTFRSWLS
jgi:IS30 family transposase